MIKMRIIIETPFKTIQSIQLPDKREDVINNFQKEFEKMVYLTVRTLEGPVILPRELLNNSIIRFVED